MLLNFVALGQLREPSADCVQHVRDYEAKYRQRGRAAHMRRLRHEAYMAERAEIEERRERLRHQAQELADLKEAMDEEKREVLGDDCMTCTKLRMR